MSVEYTHICDRCGERHVGEKAPIMWQRMVTIEVNAQGLPTYSPYSVTENFDLLCEKCISEVAEAIKAALAATPPKAANK